MTHLPRRALKCFDPPPRRKRFEDRTPEQVEKDTFYYKEIQRRRTRMHRKLDHHLHTDQTERQGNKRPPWHKSALIEDKEMLPLDSIQPW